MDTPKEHMLRFLLECPKKTSRTAKRICFKGTLDLMVLKTLDALGPLHGYGRSRAASSR